MDPALAGIVANTFGFVSCVLIAVWYLAPWLRARPRAAALTVLLWVHVPRFVALQVFSAQRTGLPIPNGVRDQIAYGDVAGAVLALLAIVALRYRSRAAVPITWVFVAATALDLANATAGGIREQLFGAAHDLTWMILVFYVPVLWTSLGMVVWQLLTRRSESLGG